MISRYIRAVQMFDPRKGENFRQELTSGNTSYTFSSLEHGMFACEMERDVRTKRPAQKTVDLPSLILGVLPEVGALGFAAIDPLTSKARAGHPHLSEVQESSGSMIGYFPLTAEAIRQVLDDCAQLQSYEAWIIGSCHTPFRPPAASPRWNDIATFWDYDHLLQQSDNVGSLFYLGGDNPVIIVLMRLFDTMDALVRRTLGTVV